MDKIHLDNDTKSNDVDEKQAISMEGIRDHMLNKRECEVEVAVVVSTMLEESSSKDIDYKTSVKMIEDSYVDDNLSSLVMLSKWRYTSLVRKNWGILGNQ